MQLEYIECPITTEKVDGTVIWLHGLGANGNDFKPIVPLLKLPNIRFIFPHAPEQPVTLNRGWVMPSWYDILTLEESPQRESESDIRSMSNTITELVKREEARGLRSDQIVLGGFSQGGAMALHSGLRYPRPLAGIMALSTYLVLPQHLEFEADPLNSITPLLHCHGAHDDIVKLHRGKRTRDTIQALWPEREQSWHEFPMGHEICLDEITVISQWLRQRFYP